jgi:hypothetical protein
MATPQEVKLALELALHLASAVNMFEPEAKELLEITEKIRQALSPNPKPEDHPVDALLKKGKVELPVSGSTPQEQALNDALLKKGKVELPDGRYKQLIQIYEELSVLKIKFLSAKQNPYIIWFPLEWNGDKSAALYLSSSEWSVAPIEYRDDNDLTGEWEGFDLTEFMAMNCPKFDQDEY